MTLLFAAHDSSFRINKGHEHYIWVKMPINASTSLRLNLPKSIRVCLDVMT